MKSTQCITKTWWPVMICIVMCINAAYSQSYNECPSGYVVGKSASGRQDGYCLLFVDSFNTWYDAMMDCESRGGVLPDVNDAELQNQLFNLSSTRSRKCARYWVGGTKDVSSDSRRRSYYQRTCAYLSTARTRGGINDYFGCETSSMACHVCQVNARRPRCPEGTIPMPSGCVEIVDTAQTWEDARDTCRDKRGRLPIIRTDEDINFLKVLRGKYGRANLPIWIGAQYIEERGFFNVDRRRFNFNLFAPGRPREPTKPESCVLLPGNRQVKVTEESCKKPQRFFCVIDRV